MKNNFFIFFFLILLNNYLHAEDFVINSKNISIDKNSEITIFEDEVNVTTQNNQRILSDYAEYDKKNNFILLKGNVRAVDDKNNIIETEYAEYLVKEKTFSSIGVTKITTSNNYIVEGKDIIMDNIKNFIKSDKSASIRDLENNQITLSNFDYQTNTSIFKSIGNIKIIDKKNNEYLFSQLYIDTNKKEILGTDMKTFLKDEDFKNNKDNKPRIFANSFISNQDTNIFDKSIFTTCNYREDDKCPPWTIQSKKMLHDRKKKSIYYDNAIVKIYDIPIFYFPKLSHPDPTVKRRSGFLVPTLVNTKNLGNGISIPYFFAVDEDKNFTLNNKIFLTENPLLAGQYQQAFKNMTLFSDFGYTKGYKDTSAKKKAGEKSHFFAKIIKEFSGTNKSENSLTASIQEVSNDKYLKLYEIESDIVDYNTNTLENYVEFSHEKEDLFFGFNINVYENLKDNYNDKYEYILPEITFDKNLFFDEKLGALNIESNFKSRNYDTNKFSTFFVNNFNWISKDYNLGDGLRSNLIGEIKNINYETKNIKEYKNETTSEIFGALGLLSQLNLRKNVDNTEHFLTPKLLLKYSPGQMRKENDASKLDPIKAFELNRLEVNNNNNYETGLSSTIGFDYEAKNNYKQFNFSVAQIINAKENKKMHSKTSLDEKLSDLVGSSSLKFNENISLNYNFALDQNYNDFNYNEIGTKLNFGQSSLDFTYLEENKHIGDQKYLTSKIDINRDKSLLSFKTKRNLKTNSSEFYNLSYEYINDCLRAGLVYRREFYNDSELESENSLMFKVTLTPFGDIESGTFKQ